MNIPYTGNASSSYTYSLVKWDLKDCTAVYIGDSLPVLNKPFTAAGIPGASTGGGFQNSEFA
jgi:hypothetical protein